MCKTSATLMKVISCPLLNLPPNLTYAPVFHDYACGPVIVNGKLLSLPQFADGEELPTIHATGFAAAFIRAVKALADRSAWPRGVVTAETTDSINFCRIEPGTLVHIYMERQSYVFRSV
jgi:hypothetical protein